MFDDDVTILGTAVTSFPGRKDGRGVNITAYYLLVPMLRTSAAIHIIYPAHTFEVRTGSALSLLGSMVLYRTCPCNSLLQRDLNRDSGRHKGSILIITGSLEEVLETSEAPGHVPYAL